MNRRSTLFVLTSALAAMLAVPAFSLNHPSTAKVAIPFAFSAGTAQMPAGNYVVAPYETQGVVSLMSEAGDRRILLLTRPGHSVAAKQGGKLVFHRNGVKNALAEVWLPGEQNSLELPTPSGQPVVVAFAY